jgi:hypothetical protein
MSVIGGAPVVGYVASGAFVIVAGEAGCTPSGGEESVLPVLAKFADDGDAAGCRPVDATACGVALADGSFGASEFVATAVSADDSHGFHQAQRGPDWQPTNPATRPANMIEWTAAGFITLPSSNAGKKKRSNRMAEPRITYDTSARPPCDIDTKRRARGRYRTTICCRGRQLQKAAQTECPRGGGL